MALFQKANVCDYQKGEHDFSSPIWHPSPNIITPSKEESQAYLAEELFHESFGPFAVHRPLFGGVADISCMQQQGEGFWFVDPGEAAVQE